MFYLNKYVSVNPFPYTAWLSWWDNHSPVF